MKDFHSFITNNLLLFQVYWTGGLGSLPSGNWCLVVFEHLWTDRRGWDNPNHLPISATIHSKWDDRNQLLIYATFDGKNSKKKKRFDIDELSLATIVSYGYLYSIGVCLQARDVSCLVNERHRLYNERYEDHSLPDRCDCRLSSICSCISNARRIRINVLHVYHFPGVTCYKTYSAMEFHSRFNHVVFISPSVFCWRKMYKRWSRSK